MDPVNGISSTPRATSPASHTPKSRRRSDMSQNKPIRRVAIIGTGVIGASWATLFLANGLDVVATDVAPGAEAALKRFVAAAWPAMQRLGLASGASQNRLSFTAALTDAVKDADLVQENGPEKIDFKKTLYRQLDELLHPSVIIASSSSGLTMSEIQSACELHPERCVIGHPFNPPHLVPLVEIVGAADVDTALCWGPGLRWGIMGNMMLNHLGGGPGGIEHFFQQFSGPMTAWWKTLGSPVLTPEVQKKLIDSVHAEVGSRTIQELEAERDEVLLGLIELRNKVAKSSQTKSTATVA